MHTKLLPTVVLGFVIGLVGCGSGDGASNSNSGGSGSPSGGATGGTVATGGKTSSGGTSSGGKTSSGGTSSGGTSSGGTSSGGISSGGKASGGTSTGGTSSGGSGKTATGGVATGGGGATGGAGAGGTATGGKATGGTATAGAGGTGTGGVVTGGAGGSGGAIGLKNAPVPSVGCGKATTVTNGKKTITSKGQQRTYIIDIPTDYDMNKPYRMFYTSHWIGSTSEAVRDQNYYFLKPLANAAKEPAIFVAPQSDGSMWQEKDHALFDDILAFVKENLCIDTTRVFATGFSFGGMITYSLSVNHQKDIRAAVGIAPANYNIFVPSPKSHAPIAWMQTTGMGDGTCPWVNGGSTTQGAKFIAIEHATDNGCTVPANVPTWERGQNKHLCYDFEGCKTGFPTKACTFDGGHTNVASDPGSNANWIPEESWKFFTQF
jgi:poly(3-hydroxybutyrate) depolymerase